MASRRALPATIVIAAALWTVAATLAARQQPTFRATVELVRVDVVVTDRDGRPIEGLTRDDFVVYDQKKRQSIAAFDEVRHEHGTSGAAAAFPSTLRLDVASNASAASDRLVVLALDDLHGYAGRTDTVKTIARRIVGALGPQASMAVIFTSGEHSTEVTEDRSVLLAAIDAYRGRRAVRRPTSGSDERGGPIMDVPFAVAGTRTQSTNLVDFGANMSLYGALQSAAQALGGEDARRKALVLISEGVAKDLTGLFDAVPAGDRTPAVAGTYAPADLAAATAATAAPFHDRAVIALMEALRRSNVAMYAVDPRGRVNPEDLLAECVPTTDTPDPCLGNGSSWSGWVRQAQQGLSQLAQASGGVGVVDTNDFTGGVDQVLDDLDHYYVLGFYPSDTSGKSFRPLDVQVVNPPGAVVRYRRGYELQPPAAPAKHLDPLAELSSGVLPKTDLPLRLFATALPGTGKTARVPVSLELTVPRQQLEESDATLADDVRYSILVVDLKGRRVAQRDGQTARMGLRPRVAGAPPPDHATYQIDVNLALEPGRYQLRASAESTKLAKGGSVYLALDVPDYARGPLAVSGLTIGYAGGARVPVFAGDAVPAGRGGRGRGQPAPRAATASIQTAPTLDREFSATDVLWIAFEVVRRDPASAVATRLVALDAKDTVVRYVDDPVPAGQSGKISLEIPLRGLAAGQYRLRVTALQGQQVAAQEIGITVR